MAVKSHSLAVHENISKARKAFFALGNIGVFHGNLNSLSRCSIETCILSILLCGCETWLLDSLTIKVIESFQNEIGHRPSEASFQYCGLDHLALGLMSPPESLSASSLTWQNCSLSLTTPSATNVSLVQQSRMLEADTNTSTLAMFKQPCRCPKYCEICKMISNQIMKNCCDLPPLIPQLNTQPPL